MFLGVNEELRSCPGEQERRCLWNKPWNHQKHNGTYQWSAGYKEKDATDDHSCRRGKRSSGRGKPSFPRDSRRNVSVKLGKVPDKQ